MTRDENWSYIKKTCKNILDVDASPLDILNPQPNHLLFNAQAQLYLYCEIAIKVGKLPPDEWLLGGGFSDMDGLLDWMVKATEGKEAVSVSS